MRISTFHDRKCDEPGRQFALENLAILDSPPEEPFERIVDLVKQTLSVPICAVSLIDRDRQWLKASRGLAVSETARDVSFCTHAIGGSGPFVVPNAVVDMRFSRNPLVTGDLHIRSYAGIPLTMPDGYNVGTLCAIDTRPRDFADHEISILEGFAKVVVNEIDLRQQASVDALTGAMCRGAWFKTATAELERGKRYGRPTALIIIDLDHFKHINDTFGHAVGDEVLKGAAKILQGELRQSDCFGRFGGEEFVVLLPETTMEQAEQIAHRMRQRFEFTIFPALGRRTCTLSAGVTEANASEGALSDFLRAADNALYLAKRDGRNTVMCAKPEIERAAA